MRLKANAAEFQAALTRHNRPEVYHWTPAKRLASVLTHGILCRRELDGRGIAYDPHSYGAFAKETDFAGHVCVSFYPQKGMMRNEAGPTAIIVMPSIVVAAARAFYCPGNTARNEFDFADLAALTEVDHLDALFLEPNAWHLVDWQAEVWIPDGIPVDRISQVLFRTAEERDEAVAACASIASRLPKDIPFRVGTWHFPTPEIELVSLDATADEPTMEPL